MKKVVWLIALVVMMSLLGCSHSPAPEPEQCSLCGYTPSHALCLVNLNSGEIGELRCYDPHPTKAGEISEFQRGGYFCFLYVAGVQGYLDACIPEAHVYVPARTEKYNEQHFCSSCRTLLSEYTNKGYALADLQCPDSPVLYPVEDGKEFSIRCYEVTISSKEKDELDIQVIGTIELGGESSYQIDETTKEN